MNLLVWIESVDVKYVDTARGQTPDTCQRSNNNDRSCLKQQRMAACSTESAWGDEE